MLRKVLLSTKINNYNKFVLVRTIKLPNTQQRVETEFTENKYVNRANEILGKYSTEEQEKILKKVNNYDLKEFTSYEISKGRVKKLLSWRNCNGVLKNIHDIISIEGFGLKVTDKFYQSLLTEPKEVDVELGKSGKTKTAPFSTPSLEAEQQTAIKSCVSVRIGVNSITWARLEVPGQVTNTPCLLTHWQHHEISEKKLHINELVQRCLYVNHMIPSADCYLFENPQMAQASNNPGSVEQQNINIQKAQVIAMMGCVMAARNCQLKKLAETDLDKKLNFHPSVFYLRRFLTARLFNHLVGTERVSSEQTVINMMRTYYNTNEMNDFLAKYAELATEEAQQSVKTDLSFSGNVQFPDELRDMFYKSPRVYREFLGQALLLNLAFVRLVLLQDSESIAMVTRGNKQKSMLTE